MGFFNLPLRRYLSSLEGKSLDLLLKEEEGRIIGRGVYSNFFLTTLQSLRDLLLITKDCWSFNKFLSSMKIIVLIIDFKRYLVNIFFVYF